MYAESEKLARRSASDLRLLLGNDNAKTFDAAVNSMFKPSSKVEESRKSKKEE